MPKGINSKVNWSLSSFTTMSLSGMLAYATRRLFTISIGSFTLGFFSVLQFYKKNKIKYQLPSQLGAVEYTDCTSAEG